MCKDEQPKKKSQKNNVVIVTRITAISTVVGTLIALYSFVTGRVSLVSITEVFPPVIINVANNFSTDSNKTLTSENPAPVSTVENSNNSELTYIETITTTSHPSDTDEFIYEYVSSNYIFDGERSMKWVYTYEVYRIENSVR
jgi:hypothetical protein